MATGVETLIVYQKAFGLAMRIYEISKLSDSDMENTETQVWLNFALNCNYISDELCQELKGISKEIGKLIDFMIHNPDKFTRRT
jgi:hypothetical protein